MTKTIMMFCCDVVLSHTEDQEVYLRAFVACMFLLQPLICDNYEVFWEYFYMVMKSKYQLLFSCLHVSFVIIMMFCWKCYYMVHLRGSSVIALPNISTGLTSSHHHSLITIIIMLLVLMMMVVIMMYVVVMMIVMI